MGAAYFYHLTRHSVEVTLAMLLGKALDAGWRVAVRSDDLGRLQWLDQKLWETGAQEFLPHALAQGGQGAQDQDQPVLLCPTSEMANDPHCVMCLDGAVITSQEVMALERVCIIFDGMDAQALQDARVQWKTLKEAGVAAQYWSQAEGRWEKKAET